MFMLRRSTLVLVSVALFLMTAGCSDGDGSTVTTPESGVSSGDDVVFGSGELPETIPADFPLPGGSAIGSTMVVTSSDFTEVVVRINAEQSLAVEFFDQSLEPAGFTVDSSAAQDGVWLIEFSSDGADGTIEISEPTQGISQAVIRYNVP